MKNMYWKSLFLHLTAGAVFGGILLMPADGFAQGKTAKPAKSAAKAKAGKKDGRKGADVTDKAKMEYNAQLALKKGLEYLEQNQEERGVKTLNGVIQQYPETKAAVKAELALGNYYIEKKQYDLAIKRFQKVAKLDDPDIQAESLYKIGICYYNAGEYNQAFMSLRQVVNKFPGSIYANEAFYYIGLCHFSLHRWTQAVDALERVGTSVPVQSEEERKKAKENSVAEAGQRLFVKIYDEDLTVLEKEDEDKVLRVKVTNTNGDEEVVKLERLGKDGAMFITSIPMQPGLPVKNDGTLQTCGGDKVTVTYVDQHTTSGKINQPAVASIPLVSTASVGFTNGDYQDYCGGIFADQDFFMRVRDLDRDITKEKDTVKVKVTSKYKEEKQDEDEKVGAGVNFEDEAPEFKVRDTKEYVLTETGSHTGVFVGSSKTSLFDPENQVEATDDGKSLNVQKDDIIEIEYIDDVCLASKEPETRVYKANLLTGELGNVKIQNREVDDLIIKAKKNLIEGKMLLHLAQIFKDVGLTEYANNKAIEGVEKIDAVLKINMEAALESSMLEEAFNTKWELLIVQDKIKEAVAVCSTLIKLFPDSALVDRALIKIAEIKIKEGTKRSIDEGLNIYRGIIQLPKSDLKAEAQYRIAEVMQAEAIARAKQQMASDPTYKPDYSGVMLEYKKVSDNYPDSSFAGDALQKIAQFYMDSEDYQRVLDMMEQVFQDYPDADFLDKMLYTWAAAAFKMERFEVATEKCEQLMSEYPNSQETKKGVQLRQLIRNRVASLSEGE